MKEEQDRELRRKSNGSRSSKKPSVTSYLAILFGAAFLLLLMTYFMQQRTSDAALDHQETINVNTMKSLEELRSDNEAFQTQVAQLSDQVSALEEALREAKATSEETRRTLSTLETQYSALTYLNQIRALYNERSYSAARELLPLADQALSAAGGMEGALSSVTRSMSEEELELYDPLSAYQSLVDWLS